MIKRFIKYMVMAFQTQVFYWLLLMALTEYMSIVYWISAVISTITLSFIGFIISSVWVWRGHKPVEGNVIRGIIKEWRDPIKVIKLAYQSRFVRFYITGICGSAFGIGILYICVDSFKLWYVFGLLISYIIGGVVTFIVRDKWVWND
jgi:putative flippase GtrA